MPTNLIILYQQKRKCFVFASHVMSTAWIIEKLSIYSYEGLGRRLPGPLFAKADGRHIAKSREVLKSREWML